MRELDEFILILNAECDRLKKVGLMPESIAEPWRFYSLPLDDEHEHELLRSVIEAGRFVVDAEAKIRNLDENGAWCSFAKAQAALLISLSSAGRLAAKKHGQAKGGSVKQDAVHERVFIIADDLLAAGACERGLAAKVANVLGKEEIGKTENQVRDILKSQLHMRLKR
jgi:hypothetical protein